ncbi:MAG: ABC transporter permease [Candidatus Kapabacteria bacterium]|nr:ABC transporter permease [Candidatus Kapabacteria bacterium]
MNFNKIGVIIRHEVKTRIFTKGFLIGTLLAPVGLLVMTLVPVLTSLMAEDSADKRIAIVDNSGVVAQKVIQEDSSLFVTTTLPVDSLTSAVKNKTLTGYIIIPKDYLTQDTIPMFTSGGGGLMFYQNVESALRKVLRQERLVAAGADSTILNIMSSGIELTTQKINDKGVEKDSGEILALLGYVMGFFIYMMMFIYGGIVMRAVLEEKTNRIVEVIASSAKPFEIMLGKILGVGAVGLLQVLLWVGMSAAVSALAGPVIQHFIGAGSPEQAVSMLQANKQSAAQLAFNLPSISPWLIIGFVFYFLSGYFLYSSLFAAVAAAADQEQDMQTLQIPITLPLIIPMLMIGNIISAPDGTLATVMSMIPFFTPTLMIVRCASTTVPMWQIVTSTILVIATFAGTVWAAGRIYRVGILSYGKKASFKDIAKWLVKG